MSESSIIIGLLQNVAMLLAFSMLYDYWWADDEKFKNLFVKILVGVILGGIGIVLMLTPWTLYPGLVFDTRSIMLLVAGLFFGSISSIASLLANNISGDLNSEQEKQVGFIQNSANSLSKLVDNILNQCNNNLLGTKVMVNEFTVTELFKDIQIITNQLKPDNIQIAFKETNKIPKINSDKSKIGEIIRNLIIYALENIKKGEINVIAEYNKSKNLIKEFTEPKKLHEVNLDTNLNIIRNILTDIKGQIKIESKQGQGSKFMVLIPEKHIEIHYLQSWHNILMTNFFCLKVLLNIKIRHLEHLK